MRQVPWRVTWRMTALQLRALLTANWLCCKKFYARCLILCRRALRQCQMQHCHSLLIKTPPLMTPLCHKTFLSNLKISTDFSNPQKTSQFPVSFISSSFEFFCRNRKKNQNPDFSRQQIWVDEGFSFHCFFIPRIFFEKAAAAAWHNVRRSLAAKS